MRPRKRFAQHFLEAAWVNKLVAAAGITKTRVPIIAGYRKVDERTVAVTTTVAASYFPYMMVYLLFTAPSSFEKGGRTWAGTAMLPAAGTGPFRITRVSPREAVDLARFDGYWVPLTSWRP